MAILLFISLLAHLITFVVIFNLAKQLQSIKNERHNDLSEQLSGYLEAIREENRHLEATLADEKKQSNHTTKQGNNHIQTVESTPIETGKSQTAPISQEPEMSLEAQVLHHYAKGMTVEEIARELDCGQTEAELIIKFHRNAYNNP
ncbi:DUF6115 domain-containing protein [Lentibacillus cibarius]|uniref:DUF2802 domain-containing protein n=1 Tax=Lentibacillus cibarius TaxID=2583219 RepID=A0A5S3QNY1_9BACI|nr:hypothetical protein [Lentibacillus cibarius]TMN23600.1 hypothetical protein FFL34_16945 [Lentibacillus cibarius]